jgi:hypothetical protein
MHDVVLYQACQWAAIAGYYEVGKQDPQHQQRNHPTIREKTCRTL